MRQLLSVFTLIVSFATPPFALAATIEPSSSDLAVMPGETAVATISVKNDSEIIKNYSISFVEAKFGDDAEQLSFSPLSFDLENAFTASASTFVLASSESKTVDVEVKLPVGVLTTSPTIGVLVTEENAEGSGGVRASVISLLFLHLSGQVEKSFVVDSFVAVPSFTFGSPTMISALFRNDGNETVVLPNELRVYGPLGREIGVGQLSVEPKHLPPATIRAVTTTWPERNGFSRLFMGRYKIELWNGDVRLARTFVTIMPPIVLIGAVLTAVLALLGIIMIARRRRH